ncbi:MAG: hypothetical protein MK192_06695 [Idiomarina sp.]|jgi:hypothetical protein|nr:hypothetical protein [Idiomarina sp.]
MNKKDLFYIIIIVGLITYIISGQESEPTTNIQHYKQPTISKTEPNFKANEFEDNQKNEYPKPIESAAKNVEVVKENPNHPNSEYYENNSQPTSLEKAKKQDTVEDIYAKLRKKSTSEYSKLREEKFSQAPPDVWGDEMKNEVETLYYRNVSQSNIERFDTECKAKMCNIDLVIDKDANKSEFSNLSGKIFPPSTENGPSYVMTTVSGNTITIKADFDKPIKINDN